jgi:Mg2+-importing ATPase
MMLYLFDCWQNPALFHTGWFIGSLFTQTLIIHFIRTNKMPFVQSWASWPLILSLVIIVSVGALLTISPLAEPFGLVALPLLYWALLAGILLSFVVLIHLGKVWFYRRFGE